MEAYRHKAPLAEATFRANVNAGPNLGSRQAAATVRIWVMPVGRRPHPHAHVVSGLLRAAVAVVGDLASRRESTLARLGLRHPQTGDPR